MVMGMSDGDMSVSGVARVSCLHMECGRGRGPRGILLGGTFVLLLLDNDEPVRWLAACVDRVDVVPV